jgi:uncharacterized protein (DUF1778 family)
VSARKTVQVNVRMSLHERWFLQQAAELSGVGFGDFIKDAALRAASDFLPELERYHTVQAKLIADLRRKDKQGGPQKP